jgi:hypothetical protein
MQVSVRIFGAQKLVEKMGNLGAGVVEFPGGTTTQMFEHLLSQYGFTWADFPVLENWEENINMYILHNDDILLKADYGRKQLADGDKLSFHIQAGCC